MKKLLNTAILSISLLTVMAAAAVAPSIGSISESFKGVDPILIKMILTLPAIAIIPFSILSGKLLSKLRKKSILIVGLILYLIGGIGGGFAPNIYVLLGFRLILGVGVGLIMPLSTGLIADFFEGEKREKMMGFSGAVSNLGGIIGTVFAGFLATSISWRASFWVYSMGIIVLLLVIFTLPEPERRKNLEGGKEGLNRKVYTLLLFSTITMVIFYTLITNIALFVKSENLGGASVSGIMISSATLAAFIGGLFFSSYIKLFKKYAVHASLIIAIGGFILLALSKTVLIAIVGIMMVGFAVGTVVPLINLNASKSVSANSTALALSIVGSGFFLGQFISPIIFGQIGKLFGNSSIRFVFSSAGVMTVVVLIVYTIYNLKKKLN